MATMEKVYMQIARRMCLNDCEYLARHILLKNHPDAIVSNIMATFKHVSEDANLHLLIKWRELEPDSANIDTLYQHLLKLYKEGKAVKDALLFIKPDEPLPGM